jgi:hypothetical protein
MVHQILSFLVAKSGHKHRPKLAISAKIEAAKQAKSMLVGGVAGALGALGADASTFRLCHYKCASAEKVVSVVIISASNPSVFNRQLP